MKNLISRTILIGLLSISYTTQSQILDIGGIEGLARSIDAGSESDVELKTSTPQPINEDTVYEELEEEDEEVFGYSGRRDFLTAPEPKEFELPLEHFGYDYFKQSPSTFIQDNNVPISPDYTIGPGDVLKVALYGTINKKFNLEVNREGEVYFPEIGPISIAGLSLTATKTVINNAINRKFLGTQSSLTLGRIRSINVFVLGEVNKPGMYTVSSFSTLTNAIFASRGIKSSGSLRNILLKRNGETVSDFDFYDLMLKGDTSKDSKLQANDVIFIPPIGKSVGIDGEVTRPAIYELKDGETIDDLVRFSGNFKSKAQLSTVDLERIEPDGNGFSLTSLNLQDANFKNFNLQNGDNIKVYSVINTMNNALLVSGHAQRPGFYSLKDGLKFSDIIASKADLLPLTDLDYVLLKRESDAGGFYTIFQLNINDIFSNPESTSNIILKEKDEIIFFPDFLPLGLIQTELRDIKSLTQEQLNFLRNISSSDDKLDDRADETSDLSMELADSEKPLSNSFVNTSNNEIINNSFYNYTIHDYCVIPQYIGKKIMSSNGFSKNAFPIEEVMMPYNNIRSMTADSSKSSVEMSSLKPDPIQNQLDKLDQLEEPDLDVSSITDICRRQLLEPLIELIRRQASPSDRQRVIEIFGNVYFEGEYPLTESMTLEKAMNAAGGLKDATYTTDIEILSNYVDSKEFNRQRAFSGAMNSSSLNKSLKSGDLINIKRIPQGTEIVTISGEVFFPGRYPISRNESLAELIERAGGLTNRASPRGAIFERTALKRSELTRLKQAQSELRRSILISGQTTKVGEEKGDSLYMNQLTTLLEDSLDEGKVLGRLVIDLEGLLSGLSEDVILEAGDAITIPKMQQTIAVIGEVFAPNTHIYSQNSGLDEYIDLSGGLTEFADKSNSYIIKADGSIISSSNLSRGGFFRVSNNLEPGDTIVVPIQVTSFSGVRATAEVTQIIYQMALAAAAVNSF